jgi:hypothetical protein
VPRLSISLKSILSPARPECLAHLNFRKTMNIFFGISMSHAQFGILTLKKKKKKIGGGVWGGKNKKK